MFVLGHLLITVAGLLRFLLTVAMLLFIVRAAISWFRPNPNNSVVGFIDKITEPVLFRIRRLIPSAGTLDFSPLIAILICWFLNSFIVQSLADLGTRLLR